MGCKRVVRPLGEIPPPEAYVIPISLLMRSAHCGCVLDPALGNESVQGTRARDQAAGHGGGSADTVVGAVAERVVIGLAIVSSVC